MMIVGLNTNAQIILIGLIGGSTLFTFIGGSHRTRVPFLIDKNRQDGKERHHLPTTRNG